MWLIMSSEEKKQEVIHTKIWREEPEPDNPFAAQKCFCAGYDVYGDLLGKASWIEYLYLLFNLEKPTHQQQIWQKCGQDLKRWKDILLNPTIEDRSDVWLPIEHPPGFDPNGTTCPTPVLQTLTKLAESVSSKSNLKWLIKHQVDLEASVGIPVSFPGVIATAFTDLNLSQDQGEMMYLLLRLPGAAVHALEQKSNGWKRYPFFINGLHISEDND